jgi:hypothetical protein
MFINEKDYKYYLALSAGNHTLTERYAKQKSKVVIDQAQ